MTSSLLYDGGSFLEKALENGITNGYSHAMLAYVFALAGKEEKVEFLLQILDQSATKTRKCIHSLLIMEMTLRRKW